MWAVQTDTPAPPTPSSVFYMLTECSFNEEGRLSQKNQKTKKKIALRVLQLCCFSNLWIFTELSVRLCQEVDIYIVVYNVHLKCADIIKYKGQWGPNATDFQADSV